MELAYLRKGVCIMAVQTQDGANMVLAPLRQMQAVQKNDLFALAQDELSLHGIARCAGRCNAEWKAVFRNLQRKNV